MNLDDSQEISKEKEIFVEAYDQYTDQIYRFIYFKVGSTEEAQDLTSAVFLKTWDYLQRNKVRPKTLKALIYRIARNAVIDFYRERSSSKESFTLVENENIISDDKQDLSKQLEIKSDLVLVEKKLLELKDEYREVIILRFTEGFSVKEIAEIIEKSRGNTRVLIYRALKALKELINQVSN